MRTSPRLRILAILAIVLLSLLPPHAAAQGEPKLFLRVVTQLIDVRPPTAENLDELLIFEDGTVIQLAGDGCRRRYVGMTKADTWLLRDLRAVLGANRIGFAQGDCRVEPGSIPDLLRMTVSWIGKPPRQRTFTVDISSATPCQVETVNITNVLKTFRHGIGPGSAGPGSVTVVRAPQGPDCRD